MKNALQTLGIAKDFVEHARSTDTLEMIVQLAELNYKAIARLCHPDRNPDPVAHEFYQRATDAIEDIRDPDGFQLAIDWLLDETDRQQNMRAREAAYDRERKDKSLEAVYGLLEHTDQFSVLDVSEATSFLLSFGGTRSVLEVINPSMTVLALMSPEDLEMVPEFVDKAEYIDDHWREMYLKDREESWIDYEPGKVEKVTVIGFVPKTALFHQTGETYRFVSDLASLESGGFGVQTTPAWTSPSEAWFVQYLEPHWTEGSEVVVRNRTGYFALVGSVQAQAPSNRK